MFSPSNETMVNTLTMSSCCVSILGKIELVYLTVGWRWVLAIPFVSHLYHVFHYQCQPHSKISSFPQYRSRRRSTRPHWLQSDHVTLSNQMTVESIESGVALTLPHSLKVNWWYCYQQRKWISLAVSFVWQPECMGKWFNKLVKFTSGGVCKDFARKD